MSQLGSSSTRFMIWFKENAHFISLMGLTAGSLSYVGGSFFVLRSDLRAERERRRQDAAHYKTLLAAERSERKSG